MDPYLESFIGFFYMKLLEVILYTSFHWSLMLPFFVVAYEEEQFGLRYSQY